MTRKPRVYIETSIPSFYFEIREEPEMVARRLWTRSWWDEERHNYELVTAVPVLEELGRGGHPRKDEVLRLVADLPLLPVELEVDEIVKAYIEKSLMPKDPRGDALHLALASFHRCHFLLTWNCASGKCQQVRAHQAHQHNPRYFRPNTHDTDGAH